MADEATGLSPLRDAEEAADMLHCSTATVRRLVKEGELRCIRHGAGPRSQMFFSDAILREYIFGKSKGGNDEED